MSSLLQSPGRVKAGRVEVFCYRVVRGPKWEEYNGPASYKQAPKSTTFYDDAEPVTLARPDGTTTVEPRLYRIWRKPAGMLGCWVVFRINGEEMVPDLSVPLPLFDLPRDAEPLTDEEAAAYWFGP